jgi:hypothetical protein
MTNAENVSLLFPGFTLRLVQDPAFERITHVFRETRSVYLDQEMYGRSDYGIRGREFTFAATGCRTPVEKSTTAKCKRHTISRNYRHLLGVDTEIGVKIRRGIYDAQNCRSPGAITIVGWMTPLTVWIHKASSTEPAQRVEAKSHEG